VGSDDADKKVTTQGGESLNYLPTRRFKVPVDEKTVRANGTVNATDTVVSDVYFELSEKKNVIVKNDLAILNIIAANKWKRPIYFTAPYTASEMGLSQFVRKDGLTYRLVPVKNNTGINTDWVVDKLMNKFAFGHANLKSVYFDEQNRLHLNTIRGAYADGAAALADDGRKEEAKKLLVMADKGILEENHPYAMVSHNNQHNYFTFRFLEACYKSGYKELADHVSKALHKDFDQQMKYYQGLPESKQDGMKSEMQGAQQLQQMLTMMDTQYKGGSLFNNPEIQNIISNTPDSGEKKKDSKRK
jgi:hypothetical protein